ncbi:hypothetical protein QBC40DRAFT_281768 [Triangularia verruculosa]|uniref:Uncharacterized protein n=1 Tax=Triangularia verruculosa TaxID=2587418 RepID=A0AAN7AUC9_9PEZI|nr:hypothetical protein QBC40DRAFT_281768 [Triangularia verruculosa]
MQFTTTTLAFLAMTLPLNSALTTRSADSIPDGGYTGQTFANGTTLYTPLEEGKAFLVAPSTAPVSAKLGKRYTGCFGGDLDHSGVDASVQRLRDWAGNGRDLASGSINTWIGFINEGMLAYYCIDAPFRSGNLDVNDVNHALREMDRVCGFYKSSYFKWDGSVEIVGKDYAGANICV